MGRSAEADRLAEENLERAQLFGTTGAIGFAQYVVALTRPRCEREPLLIEAVSRLQAAGHLLDEASAQYELGKTLQAVGEDPEIANQLFLARRTVEFHLSGVYRKLELTGRHELVRLLGEGA
ncbi:LuxR C-terminal-related transcriptional regulator [Streptomyces sp. SID13031]|uniref:LuxR C-terminal-related transcriptional regulator n=1 Tax=Streptomyces sp. SID13031 TaxID=2706046 RepID=UPI001EF39AE8|nr:LuxR C-terminal-related transcriptional regulator [Streptomyces sp. SID13031]